MSGAIGNLVALAARPSMPSIVTLRKIMAARPDFPVIAFGKRGRGHVIDLDEAERFVRAVRSHQIIDPAQRRAAIRVLGLEMLTAESGHCAASETTK